MPTSAPTCRSTPGSSTPTSTGAPDGSNRINFPLSAARPTSSLRRTTRRSGMTEASKVQFVDLDDAETEAILARNHVGRLAFTFKDKVDIEPLSYVYAGGVINFRTAPGTKLEVLLHQPSVAFEVDEVR